MIEIILIIVLGLLSSWEEINELYRDGSWKKDMFYPFLFWETNPKWKNFDSKHTSFGAFALVLFIILQYHDNKAITLNILSNFKDVALVLIYWVFFFYIRNLGLHILLRRKGFRQWKYLLPFKIG
jgi:hypothetical protein